MKNEWFNIIEEKLKSWWEYLVAMLPNFLLAIVVTVLFIFLARFFRKVSEQFILRISKRASISSLLSGLLYSAIVFAGIMTALSILQLDTAVSSLLAGVGIVGLALGFAFQDLTSNFISGAFIALRRPFDVGHVVETNTFTGTIEDIQLRSTTLRTNAGLHVIIPNKDIFQKPIINYSRTDKRLVEFEFVVPNSVDVAFTGKVIREALERIAPRNAIRNVEHYYMAIENPNMRVYVSFWTMHTQPREFMRVRHKAIVAIYKAFAESKIYKVQIPEELPTQIRNEAQHTQGSQPATRKSPNTGSR